MVALIMIAVHLLADAVRFSILLFRPTRSVQAENLFLRRQLALFKERGVQPRRIDSATRISLAILARCFEWRDALFVVRPFSGSRPAVLLESEDGRVDVLINCSLKDLIPQEVNCEMGGYVSRWFCCPHWRRSGRALEIGYSR